MTEFLDYVSWHGLHKNEMSDLSFAKPDDIFIYTRITGNDFSEKSRVLFARDEREAVGYIRHIFLYGLLNDSLDSLNRDINITIDCKEDVVLLMEYWCKTGQMAKHKNIKNELLNISKEFNREFSSRKDKEYEFEIFHSYKELQDFLKLKNIKVSKKPNDKKGM